MTVDALFNFLSFSHWFSHPFLSRDFTPVLMMTLDGVRDCKPALLSGKRSDSGWRGANAFAVRFIQRLRLFVAGRGRSFAILNLGRCASYKNMLNNNGSFKCLIKA